ncbi:MAG: alpha/beta fold hydrolase [Desulfobacteraceae bacterium]|nr:alpha/beta fold hydrolase [Desulfobacteraceae bacterium]
MKIHLRITILILVSLLFCTGCSIVEEPAFRFGLSMERSKSRMEKKSVMVEGRTLCYLEREGVGDVMVFLHGFGANKDNWLRFARYIPESYRVIAVDLPGHGESSLDFPGAYDVFSMERRLASAVDKLGLTRFHLAGNSMGGLVSLVYSQNRPEQILSLGLFDSAGVLTSVKSDFFKALDQGRNPLIVSTRKEYDDLLALCFEEEPFLPWPARNVLARRHMERNEHNRKMWKDLFSDTDDTPVRKELPKLTPPVLVIWGDRDRVLDVSGAMVFKTMIPDATLKIIENCGHVPMVEKPEETALIYMAFMRGLHGNGQSSGHVSP